MRRIPLTAVLVCLCALVAAPAAPASTGQLTIFQDDGRLLESGPDVRDAALDEIAAGGADVVKFHLVWGDIAPGGATRPDGFNGQDLSSYSEAVWERFDGLVGAAQSRGLRVLVAPTTPAPGWATRTRGDARGVAYPNAREFGRFVRAAATRWDGAHGQARVDFWTIGNEPNHPDFLQPQGSRSGRLIAPHLYRELVRHAVSGLRLAGHGRDTILFGELLPIGKVGVGRRNTIKPLAFIRDFFCLDRNYRPYRGRAARVRDCDRFRRIAGVTGFGYHPYTRPGGPSVRETHDDDATIRSISRITGALDRAAARGRVSPRRMRVYNTEFGFQSDPPDRLWTPIARIPAYLNQSEWMSWRNPRVASWSQYALLDDRDLSGFQSGLRFADGTPKPGVYDAYRLPLYVRRLGSRTVEVWGGARMAGRGDRVRVQSQLGAGEFTDVAGGSVAVNARGYFRKRFRVSGASRRRFRIVYGDGGSARASRETNASRR